MYADNPRSLLHPLLGAELQVVAVLQQPHGPVYIYTYIYIKRERERDAYIYIYIHKCISPPRMGYTGLASLSVDVRRLVER